MGLRASRLFASLPQFIPQHAHVLAVGAFAPAGAVGPEAEVAALRVHELRVRIDGVLVLPHLALPVAKARLALLQRRNDSIGRGLEPVERLRDLPEAVGVRLPFQLAGGHSLYVLI